MTPPLPDPAFRWSPESWGLALRCRPLESMAQHLFTTRQLTLRGPDGQGGWGIAASSLGAQTMKVMRVMQMHGRAVRVLRRGEVSASAADERPRADALVSNEPGVVLAVQVADCAPILMVDPRNGAAAAIHAGWRGTRDGVTVAAIEAMAREFGTNPNDLIVALGPSIGPCCYEVGPDLIDAFRQNGFSERQLATWFVPCSASIGREGKDEQPAALHLDMWSANRDQIQNTGVPAMQIHVSHLCTKSNPDVFHSYRIEGGQAGRMAGLIRVPDV